MRSRMSALLAVTWWLMPLVSLTMIVGCPEKKTEPVAAAPTQEPEPEPFPESQVPKPEPQPAPSVTTMDRQPAPAPAAVDNSVPPPPPQTEAKQVKPRQQPRESYEQPVKKSSRSYTVKKGDTLQKISQKYYGTTTKWRRIYDANRKAIGSDPDNLKLGQKLVIP